MKALLGEIRHSPLLWLLTFGTLAGVTLLVGGAAEMASAFSGAHKNRLDLSIGIALSRASQIALFVAPVLVLMVYLISAVTLTCCRRRRAEASPSSQ